MHALTRFDSNLNATFPTIASGPCGVTFALRVGPVSSTVTSGLSQPVDLSENTHIIFKRLT